jgi:hypothetical protein
MKRCLMVACGLALAGCNTLNAERCRSMDWNWLGQRDGYGSANPDPASKSMLPLYAAECAPHGVKPDAVAYTKGLETGSQNRLYWWGPAGRD